MEDEAAAAAAMEAANNAEEYRDTIKLLHII